MNKEPWLSLEEITKHLGVRRETIYRWLKDKDKGMPGHRVGRHWKFKLSEVDAWVKSGGAGDETKGGNQ